MTEWTDFFRHHLQTTPVMAILRDAPTHLAVSLARQCWAAGISLVEVSLSSRSGLDALAAVAAEAKGFRGQAGAGTITSKETFESAVRFGASFCVSPGLDPELVELARDMGVPYMPGVLTPSEVQQALTFGLRTLKVFPAAQVGPEWVRALLGPFPSLEVVAVGGMSTQNAREFFDVGAVAVGIGSALSSPQEIERIPSLQNGAGTHV